MRWLGTMLVLAVVATAAEIPLSEVAYLAEVKLAPVELTVLQRTPVSSARDPQSALAYFHPGQKVTLVGWSADHYYVTGRVATGPVRGWVAAKAVAEPPVELVRELIRRQELQTRNRELIARHEVGVGMTREEVIVSVGKPARQQRVQTQSGDEEQWWYGNYGYRPQYFQAADATGKLRQTVTYQRVPVGFRAVVFHGEFVTAIQEDVTERPPPPDRLFGPQAVGLDSNRKGVYSARSVKPKGMLMITFKRLVTGLVVVLLGVNLAVAARIYSATADNAAKDDPYAQFKLAAQVMELIRANYVDGEKTSYQRLTYDALKGMMNALDPHSQFMEPDMYEDMQNDTAGKFGGLGIVISMSKDGYLTVVAPMEDTPGAKAGLLPGDRIIKIDGRSTEKMSLQEAVKQLRGDPGTKVTISVFRPKAKDPGERIKDHTIERAEIKVDSVKDVKMLTDSIGYVRVTQFNAPTADEFHKALDKLEGDGLQALIIDLRNNPGGLLESAIKVSSEFLPRGELVVSTEGRDPKQDHKYYAVSSRRRPTYPIAILVNGGSASASEIVAGALQDMKRAMLVGETTFGKGSVQSILKLPDGSALRLTTAKYYTPSHKVIHEHGVVPDIVVPVSEENERKLMEQRARANLPPEEGAEKVAPVADEQLDRAIDVLKGVTLFAKQTKLGFRSAKSAAAN